MTSSVKMCGTKVTALFSWKVPLLAISVILPHNETCPKSLCADRCHQYADSCGYLQQTALLFASPPPHCGTACFGGVIDLQE